MELRSTTPHGGEGPVIDLRLGELAVAQAPGILMTSALGSCVAIALFDSLNKRGALAHIMLPAPSSASARGGSQPGRFADWAVPEMVRQLTAQGSLRMRLKAKIAGGAAMFRTDASVMSIGDRNVAEVKRQLELMSIPLLAEDTGENYARTVELHLDTGELVVRSCQFGTVRL